MAKLYWRVMDENGKWQYKPVGELPDHPVKLIRPECLCTRCVEAATGKGVTWE